MLKQYPPYRTAVVQSAGVAGGGPNRMFRPLFSHIKTRGVAMTSPVELTYPQLSEKDTDAEPTAMGFLYGTAQAGRPGADGVVEVVDVPAMTVVSVVVRGSYGQGTFRDGMAKLKPWLEDNRGRYEVCGQPRFLAYNSPFVPWFLKLGEVQIPVKRVAGQ